MMSERPQVWIRLLKAGACLAFSASHPLSAMYGGCLFAVVAIGCAAFGRDRRAMVLGLALNAVLVSAVVSPWLYAVARFHEEISIAESFKRIGPLIFDVWWQRLAPFPLDVRTLERAAGISTPYLETQTNTVLFLLALFVLGAAVVNRKSNGWLKPSGAWLACFGLLGFVCLFAFSVSTTLVRAADFLSPLQFLYRLVTYQNIAILLFLFGSLLLLNKRHELFPPVLRRNCSGGGRGADQVRSCPGDTCL